MWLLQVSSFLLPMWEVLYTLWPGPHGMLRHVLPHAPLIWCWCQSSMTAEVFRACATCNTAALFSDSWKNSQMSSILALSLPEVPAPCSFCFLQITHTHAYIDGHWCVAGSPLVPCLGCEDVVRNSWAVVTLHWHDGTHGLSELKWPRIATVTSCKTDYMWLFSKSVCRQTVCPVKPIRAAHGQDDFLPSNVALMHDHFKFSRPVNWKEPVVCAQAQAEDLSEWNTLVATTEILKQTAVAWCGVSNMTFAWVHAANVQPSIQRACSNCISWWTESSTFAWPQSSKIEGPPPPTLQLPPFVDPSTGKLQQLQEKEMVGLVYNKEPSTEVNPLPMGLPVSSEPTEPPPASEPPVEAKTPAIVSHQQMTILTKHLVLSNGALLRISFHTAWWPFRKKQVLRYI